ncbi:hypothetical protein [Galbitalea soli]|uniref:SRPBCC family protein n=1 Tax=Galbitalea soli TaxID=1268042 RepID=A0A7C9PMR5_9MICO|nr:hypothetical protein [Galbitalea soli]NEM91154.1 hypothetical protein [Galbitalea soli]NYJ29842.1 hypothetical protein [Galbitalea soli]
MEIKLRLALDCEPDDAWWAIRSPRVLNRVSFPLLQFEAIEPQGFPAQWPVGPHPVTVRALGLVAIGEQTIDVSYPEWRWGVRGMRDTGRGLNGPLSLVTRWQHDLTVAPGEGGGTLYRDRLRFEVGPLTPLAWPLYWLFWQYRAARMRRLAPGWHRARLADGA